MLSCDIFILPYYSFFRHFLEIMLTNFVINYNDDEKFLLFIAHLLRLVFFGEKNANNMFFNKYSYLDGSNHCDAEYKQISNRAQAQKKADIDDTKCSPQSSCSGQFEKSCHKLSTRANRHALAPFEHGN